jgi:predicted GTPase
MAAIRAIIMGAAGRDFHNFNTCFRDKDSWEVVAFTATQIPNIEGRTYPPELAGRLYPSGIPIFEESELPRLITDLKADQVVFAYSDVTHLHVMHHASTVLARGADFRILGPEATMLRSSVPVISICAVRTGAGKSQTTRRISDILKAKGLRVVAIRHPMPYGDLKRQAVQRFADYQDLAHHDCTIEEREEYAPHIDMGNVIYAGVDYEKILRQAEAEADVILWDGGNNDFPFIRPDLNVVVADPHRPGHEIAYFPGEVNLKMADVIIVNKVDTASPEGIEEVLGNIRLNNPQARVIMGESPISVDRPEEVAGKRVLVIEDGPTITHGEMRFGAGVIASRHHGAAEIVDPRPYARGSIRGTFEKYGHLGAVLPAMGYSPDQIRELKETVDATPCDLVVIGTPIDLARVMAISKPSVRVRYELRERGKPDLEECMTEVIKTAIEKKVRF